MKRILLVIWFAGFIQHSRAADPVPLLVINGLGTGYGSPAVTADRIFITGEKEGKGVLNAFDPDGKIIWKTEYGTEWTGNFPGSRARPVVLDSCIYTSSGMGDIGCFDIFTGRQIWSLNMTRDLHGVNAIFGYSVPVLIDNNRLFCIPGGADTNLACLDRRTGKLIWYSQGAGETPGYASMILILHHGKKILVAFTELSLLGIDADDGKVLWTHPLSIKGDAPCNDPIYDNGNLYIVAGHANGAAKLKISDDGLSITKVWWNPGFCTYFGGVIMDRGHLYGSVNGHYAWRSVDTGTGKFADSLAFRTGSVAAAGSNLIIYGQDGMAGIVHFNNGKMELTRSFRVTGGTREYFAHPVVAGGRIYFRHGDALLIYNYPA